MRKLLIATAALLALASPASAYTIDIFAAFNQNTTFSDPSGITVETYAGGPPSGNTFITTVGGNARDTFSGFSPVTATAQSGLFIGNIGGQDTSPFGLGNDTRVYLAAGGNGGVVGLNSIIGPQTSLAMLWGTVDAGDNRNLIKFNTGETVNGTQILQACAAQGFSCGDGDTNVFLRINGLTAFQSAKFSDGDLNSFEFVPLAAAVPEPATWAMMILGFAGIVVMGKKRARKNGEGNFRFA